MAIQLPQFEVTDDLGSSVQYTGTVGTSPTAFPTVAGFEIDSVFVLCDKQTGLANYIEVSLDNQTTWQKLYVGEWIRGQVKGGLKQIHLKANTAGVQYRMNIEFEAA